LFKEGKIGQVHGVSQLGESCFSWYVL